MFCTKCGSRNYDDAKFCTTCRAPLGVDTPASTSYTPPTPGPVPKPAKSNTGLIIGIIVAVVAVVVGVAIWLITSLTGINGTINKLEKGLKKCDIEILAEGMIPKSSKDDLIDSLEKETGMDLDEMEEEAKEIIDDEEIKIVSLKKVDEVKKIKKSDIREDLYCDSKSDLYDNIEKYYDVDDVSDVRKCKVKLTYKVDDEKENVSGYAYFYKSGGKWYFLAYPTSPVIDKLEEELESLF